MSSSSDRGLVEREAIADGVAPDGVAQRHILAARAAGMQRAEQLGRKRKRPRRIARTCIIDCRTHHTA